MRGKVFGGFDFRKGGHYVFCKGKRRVDGRIDGQRAED